MNKSEKKYRDIFFVINTLQSGGAERVVSTLSAKFHERKYPVTVICLNHAVSSFKLPDDLKICYLVRRKGSNVLFRVYYAAVIFFKLTWLLLMKRPRCVISFMTTANIWTGVVCFLTRSRYIVSERTTPDHTIHSYSGLLKWLSFFTYSNAKAIVVPSRGIENCLKKDLRFKALTNYRIINNPVNNSGKITGEKVNGKKFILGVGRLSYEKGFDQLIAAFQRSRAEDTDLLIAGEGAEFTKLEQQIASLNLQDKVKLVGLKENLYDYYSQAELFVLPSRNEGYPNALIEAMSTGCSCIAMDCEFGPSEIIKHHQNGLLVEDRNIEKLSKAISKVLKDPVLKGRLALNARLINNTNSLDAIFLQWEKLIFSM